MSVYLNKRSLFWRQGKKKKKKIIKIEQHYHFTFQWAFEMQIFDDAYNNLVRHITISSINCIHTLFFDLFICKRNFNFSHDLCYFKIILDKLPTNSLNVLNFASSLELIVFLRKSIKPREWEIEKEVRKSINDDHRSSWDKWRFTFWYYAAFLLLHRHNLSLIFHSFFFPTYHAYKFYIQVHVDIYRDYVHESSLNFSLLKCYIDFQKKNSLAIMMCRIKQYS